MNLKEWMNNMAKLAANETMEQAYKRGLKKMLKMVHKE